MLKQLLDFANLLADNAAIISRKHFRQPLMIKTKANHSPVTIADCAIELKLRELIHHYYPQHGIIGEEFANAATTNEYCWVLDPIDGTVAFTSGKPTFTTLIALLQHEQPVLSVIDQPIIGERFSALTGAAAYLNATQCLTSSQVMSLEQARLNATTPAMFTTSGEQDKFNKLQQSVKLTSFGGDAYGFALLAAGHIDIIMEANLEYYDVAALIPLVGASGGIISDWQGKPLTRDFNGQCLASANQQLHHQVLNLIK